MRSRGGLGAMLGAAAVTFALAACTAGPSPLGEDPAPPAESGPVSQTQTLVGELEAPWSVTFHDGTPLISERDSARILELDQDGQARDIATIAGVQTEGEGGLLGIVAHEGDLYVYSTGQGENRIQRYALTGEPGSLALGDAEIMLDGIPAARNHNGGRLAIGPDGMLYATTGDAGDPASAQDLESLGGKILRLTPDGDVPADNPFDGSLVHSYGHRNPQGLAWDNEGTMYASEFGQDTWDELNVIEAGGNYGWPEVEGIDGGDEYIDPVQHWEPSRASPSGIAVAGGSIHIANLRGQRLIHVPLDDLGTSTESLVEEHGRLRDVAPAPDGSLWVLTNNTDGRGTPADGDDRVLRLEAE